MTTAVAFRDHHGNVAIGADTMLSGSVSTYMQTKVHRVGDLWVAWSGVAIVDRYLIDASSSDQSFESLAALSDAVAAWMRERGNGKQDDDGDWFVNASLIAIGAGRQGGPWVAWGGGYCGSRGDYAAIGSGGLIAYGALFTARKRRWTAESAVRAALEAAAYHDPFTGGRLVIKIEVADDV